MASYTPNLNLLMKDPVADGADTFNIQTMLNENWEKIDRQVLRAMAAAAAYDAGTTYQQGDFCTQGGLLYRANQAIAQPEAWTAGHWTAISITDVIRDLTAADVGAVPKSVLSDASRTIYVSKNGNDATGDGSSANPYFTIAAAINSVQASGNYVGGNCGIEIDEGTYEEVMKFNRFGGPGTIQVYGKTGATVRVKAIYASYCAAELLFSNLDVYGEDENAEYVSSMDFEHCRYVFLNQITCTGEQTPNYKIAAVTAAHNTTLHMWNTTISNKRCALDCMGSIVRMNNGDKLLNNTIAIRCGTGWGSLGGLVFKGGVTVEGTEQTAYSGQIFD